MDGFEGFDRDIIAIERRTRIQTVSSGFLESWEPLGEYFGCVTQLVSTPSSFQQQFSRLARYKVAMADAPPISFGDTRFRLTWRNGDELLLQPDREPLYAGGSERTDVSIQCVNVASMLVPEDNEPVEPAPFPPVGYTNPLPPDIFISDGKMIEFGVSFTILPATSEVVVDGAYQTRNMDYYEFSDRIVFTHPPAKDARIEVRIV